MICSPNDLLIKWFVDQMICWSNDLLIKWFVHKMICWSKDLLIKWFVHQIICSPNDLFTKWFVNPIVCWLNEYSDQMILWIKQVVIKKKLGNTNDPMFAFFLQCFPSTTLDLFSQMKLSSWNCFWLIVNISAFNQWLAFKLLRNHHKHI